MIIYKAINKINNKAYIGQTIFSLQKRKKRHLYEAETVENTTIYFHKAIKKHGSKNFKWEILCRCNNIDELNKLEIYHIRSYDTFKNGYNLTEGGYGSSGFIHNENSKKTMSIIKQGIKHSEMHKSKISSSRKGQKLTEKTKAKISKATSGHQNSNYGKKYSSILRFEMSEKRKGKFTGKDNANSKAIIIENKHFFSITEAAKFLNISYKTLWNRIQKNKEKYYIYNNKE